VPVVGRALVEKAPILIWDRVQEVVVEEEGTVPIPEDVLIVVSQAVEPVEPDTVRDKVFIVLLAVVEGEAALEC
jgi:hypothetical protein